jgi:alcohol dehydrogenase
MRALTVYPGGRVVWRSVPTPPPPGPLAAVVRPIAIATCDLDRMLARGATPFPLPLHFGHECVAEVLSLGDDVRGFRPGDRVVVPFQISCGSCLPCRSGNTGNCTSVPPISMYGFGVGGGHWGGAVSDELAVPYADAMLVPLPDGIDPVHAASVADNVSDGYRHVGPYLPELLRGDPETSVLIIAALKPPFLFSASVPLYAGLCAVALGARRVYLADARPAVREHAQRLGLQPVHPDDIRKYAPAPLVVDATGHPRGLRRALNATAPDGICSSVGGLYRTARLPFGQLYARNITLHVSRTHARSTIPRVLDLMTTGRLHPETVTTCVAPIDDAPQAISDHIRGDVTKTILVA